MRWIMWLKFLAGLFFIKLLLNLNITMNIKLKIKSLFWIGPFWGQGDLGGLPPHAATKRMESLSWWFHHPQFLGWSMVVQFNLVVANIHYAGT